MSLRYLAAFVRGARQMMPGVDDEGVFFVAGGAFAGKVVMMWWEAEIEPRSHSILGVSEDVERGCGMHGLPCVGVGSGDTVQMSLGFGLSPPVSELRRGIFELVFGCLLGELALK